MAFSLMQMVRPDNINVELTLLRILPGHSSLVLQEYCVKSVQIRSLSWSVFSRIRTEYLSVLILSCHSGSGSILSHMRRWFYHATVGVGVFYPTWGDDSIMPQWEWEYSIPYEEIDSIMPQWEWEYSIPYEEIGSIMPQ